MDRNLLRVKITGNEMEALMLGYQDAVTEMDAEQYLKQEVYTPHECLLQAHATEMLDFLKKQVDKEQKNYTLGLCMTQVIAFYQLWQRKFPITTYSGNAVRKVYGIINQKELSRLWIEKR